MKTELEEPLINFPRIDAVTLNKQLHLYTDWNKGRGSSNHVPCGCAPVHMFLVSSKICVGQGQFADCELTLRFFAKKPDVCVGNLLAAIFGDQRIKGLREKGE